MNQRNLGRLNSGQSRPICVCSSSALSNQISCVHEYKYCCSDPWWSGKQTDHIDFDRLRFPKTEGCRYFYFNWKWTQFPVDMDKPNDLEGINLPWEKKKPDDLYHHLRSWQSYLETSRAALPFLCFLGTRLAPHILLGTLSFSGTWLHLAGDRSPPQNYRNRKKSTGSRPDQENLIKR